MPNEKVSQMTSLTAAEVAGNDLLLITDTSARESKKITTSDFLTYIETTGSFNALTAVTSISTSYIQGGRVDGAVSSASFAIRAYTASLAIRSTNADTASLAQTASFVSGISSVGTASFLAYAGFPNGTASFALVASNVNLAGTSSFLIYTGGSNGTASYAISSSAALTALTASSVSNSNFTASAATSASWALVAATSSYALNGIVDYQNVLDSTIQVGIGGSAIRPFPIAGLEASLNVKSTNSNFLIILSTVVGAGSGTGCTSTALWKSSSFDVVALNQTIGNIALSSADTITLVTTYIDSPQYDPGTAVTYSAQIYNSSVGPWYVNRDRNNTRFGTSSISVVEFIL